MATGHSVDDLLDFLTHAADRGLMPAATAQALGVATRSVAEVLDERERQDLRELDLPATIKRFETKRAREFSPSSLKEYGRRMQRAVHHFLKWKADPANFSVKTRATRSAAKKAKPSRSPAGESPASVVAGSSGSSHQAPTQGGYETSLPLRPGVVVTISNLPDDLSSVEAERLAGFVRLLVVD